MANNVELFRTQSDKMGFRKDSLLSLYFHGYTRMYISWSMVYICMWIHTCILM